MNQVLVVGSGGREHAMVWKLAQSPKVDRVIVAPGNPGMRFGVAAQKLEYWPLSLGLKADELRTEFLRLAKKAKEQGVSLCVIGPDNPLADGIVDAFQTVGMKCLGPTREAAKLEWSKAFAKEVMQAAGVPTARYQVATSLRSALEIFQKAAAGDQKYSYFKNGVVVKADGLALGKGVKVCVSFEEAQIAVNDLIGLSGSVVLEERLSGQEISWIAICDGNHAELLEPARDYKRLNDRDEGPNTGGMGAISPVPGVTAALKSRVEKEVFQPMLREMKKRGIPFSGFLYAGLMVNFETGDYWVIEFNSRLGDPETQVILPRIESDFYDWCLAGAEGRLASMGGIQFFKDAAVVVVGAAHGYPDSPRKGDAIRLLPELLLECEATERPGAFFAGVAALPAAAGSQAAVEKIELLTAGGRVFGAMGYGKDLGAARRQAYERMMQIRFEGAQYRSDIGRRESEAAE